MNYDITKHTAPTMPTLGNGTECIKTLLSEASKDMYGPLVPKLFPIPGDTSAAQNFSIRPYLEEKMCQISAYFVKLPPYISKTPKSTNIRRYRQLSTAIVRTPRKKVVSLHCDSWYRGDDE